ncbi:hypothetical protein ACFQL7_21790 [Halocatena marina]|uniref:Uncharacterized protein n=2 Tax=Halocatena marina TaxID=2934937 RepID=A0ABD5YS76_9EURY
MSREGRTNGIEDHTEGITEFAQHAGRHKGVGCRLETVVSRRSFGVTIPSRPTE